MSIRSKLCAAATRSVRGGGSIAQKSLVIAQAAMSLVLLSAAALLAQSLRNLERQNFGFETKDRYLVSINPTLGGYKPDKWSRSTAVSTSASCAYPECAWSLPFSMRP